MFPYDLAPEPMLEAWWDLTLGPTEDVLLRMQWFLAQIRAHAREMLAAAEAERGLRPPSSSD